MQRDMSYDLDDVFSTRGAGELVSHEVTKTRVLRTPGLRVLSAPKPTDIDPHMDHSLSNPLSKSIADTLAGDITIPVVGTVSVGKAAVGAAIGLGIWYFFLRRH